MADFAQLVSACENAATNGFASILGRNGILIERQGRNTRENALNTPALRLSRDRSTLFGPRLRIKVTEGVGDSSEFVMSIVAVMCSQTGEQVSTGIEMDRLAFEALPLTRRFVFDCWSCGRQHAWTKRWATLLDKRDPALTYRITSPIHP